jgi:hypothetical protein
MPIVRTGQSAYDKEVARWDRPRNQLDDEGLPGFAPVGFEPYPKMLHKAHRHENGKVMYMDLNEIYAVDPGVQAKAAAFNRMCQKTVGSEGEYQRAKADGWCDTPDAALEVHEKLQQDIAKAAAEAAHGVRSMSEKARGEFATADAETEHPLTDVPAPKKRGRKPKSDAVN